MGRCWFIAAVMFWVAAITATAAAQDKTFSIELNTVQDIDGQCRVTFVASNELGLVIDKTGLEVVVFNDKSIVSQILVLDFGRLPVAKTKVVQFDLSAPCPGISRLLINAFTECQGQDLGPDRCLDVLKTSTRSEIAFGT